MLVSLVFGYIANETKRTRGRYDRRRSHREGEADAHYYNQSKLLIFRRHILSADAIEQLPLANQGSYYFEPFHILGHVHSLLLRICI